MHPFPHRYTATATSDADSAGDIGLESPGLPALATAAPEEFGGPGDAWSPETLFVAAVVSCFNLTFRAVAGASKLAWLGLSCEGDATLDRVDRVTRFTEVRLRAELRVPEGTDPERARSLLERAEHICLVTNSLTSEIHLDARVVVGEAVAE
jgi:organic hydroperoxide reductase OsmC/OhrA